MVYSCNFVAVAVGLFPLYSEREWLLVVGSSVQIEWMIQLGLNILCLRIGACCGVSWSKDVWEDVEDIVLHFITIPKAKSLQGFLISIWKTLLDALDLFKLILWGISVCNDKGNVLYKVKKHSLQDYCCLKWIVFYWQRWLSSRCSNWVTSLTWASFSFWSV